MSTSFWARLTGAFAVSSAVFFPVMLGISINDSASRGLLSTAGRASAWALNGLDAIAFSVAIILLAIFAIAYPVERWLVRSTDSNWRAASIYVLVFTFLALLSVAWSFLDALVLRTAANDFTGIILVYAFAVAAIVSFFARVLYPRSVKFERTNLAISIALVAASIVGIATPTLTANAMSGEGFYPGSFDGEIARGTVEVNEADGSSSSSSTNGTFTPNGAVNDDVVYFACSEPASQSYQIIIRSADYSKTFADFPVICESDSPSLYQVNLGSEKTEINVLLSGVANEENQMVGSVNGKNTHPDAYAILVPAITY